jgi:hypothetical protein
MKTDKKHYGKLISTIIYRLHTLGFPVRAILDFLKDTTTMHGKPWTKASVSYYLWKGSVTEAIRRKAIAENEEG